MDVQKDFVTTKDGTRLAVYSAGSGPGPDILLANGLGGNIDAWRYFVDDFSPFHRIITWDYRGLYNSGPAGSGTDYSVGAQVTDLRAVLAHFGCERIIAVGWSMGVQVAFELERQHPEQVLGLVLINGTYGRPFSTAFAPVLGRTPVMPMIPVVMKLVESLAHLAEPLQPYAQKVTQTKASLRVLRALGLVSASLDEAMFLKLASQVAGLHMPRYMATLNSLGDHCAEAVLPQVDVPTLIITGDRDLFTPVSQSREMAKRITGAELLVIPSGTHYTPLEFPELIHLRVQKFLRERLGFERMAASAA
ncbi:MAG: alpha/beta hydrolase [Myxococcales bacterium]|nr:alpha/beta hydrolase [Myxococcales bacterium]